MGNKDSHGVGPPAPPSPSIRFSSRRGEEPSARGWWRSGRGRSNPNLYPPTSPYTSWRYEHQPNGAALGGGRPPGGAANRLDGSSEGSSPKVLLGKDSSMRVEFTKTKPLPLERQGLLGGGSAPDSALRTSKGSSISSDGSWYDSPWGGGAEPVGNLFVEDGRYPTWAPARNQETPVAGGNALILPGFPSNGSAPGAGYNTCSSGRTEDSGVGDSLILQPDLKDSGLAPPPGASLWVYPCYNKLPAFPTAPDASSQKATATPPSAAQEAVPEGGAGPTGAPHRNNRKDFLKTRIREISDWTGSLSRKRRRVQEPSGSGAGGSDSLWTPNPLDLQRQNIDHGFLQQLGGGARTRASEGEGEGETDGGVEEEQGVVRRAGWLSFKALLTLRGDGRLELVTRRRWRRFWVTLKGCSLLLYQTADRAGPPRGVLPADDGLVQAVPEHPRREHVFCVSNAHGDVFLLQATNQTDLENWVTAIHSASAALLARRRGRDDTLRLLRCQSHALLQQIDTDGKMKKMAELQLSVIKDPPSRRAVETQIRQWEQNLEQLHLDLFRLRCYLASLQGGEPPNPKSLLAVAGRPSKCMLGRLGVFSASSFHALVCSRDGGALRGRTLPVGRLRRRGLSASLKTLGGASGRSKNRRNSSQGLACVSNQREAPPPSGRPVQVRSLTPGDPSDSLLTPPLRVLSLHLRRTDAATDFGFAVTGHLDGGGRSHIYVSEVNPLGPSAKEGLRAGDEVLAVNGSFLSGLDLDLMESVFSLQKLQLVLRRDGRGDPDDPAHPKDPGQFPVPADLQTWTRSSDDHVPSGSFENLQENVDHAHSLFQIFPATDPNLPRNPYCGEAGLQPSSPAHLSVCQRLRKVIQELLDTERSYVKDLVLLLDVYLTPLREETFLTREEMEALFGSLPELLDFQRLFLQTLERGVAAGPDPVAMEMPGQFQKLLFSLGGAFLHYADHFKHYSGFCTNHVKVQKVLERAKTDAAFKRFLDARNPTNQHSASLESFLIKPVQRVLRYPLLLRQLVALTAPGTPEHGHLTEALRAMEEVATHINDTQKIYEDYGTVLDQLAAEQGGACRQAPPPAGQARPPPQVTEISMGDFLVQSSVVWLNPLPCLGRLRRDPELTLFVFKRAVVLVYRDSARMRRRTNGPRSADLDPFRFRWLIPVSEVQVRPAPLTGPVDPSVWELIHIRSEVEGRPEMLFQLCSSGLEMKASVLGALRSVLRPRPQSSPLRRSNNRALTAGRRSRLPEERGGANGETCSEPLLPSHAPSDHSGRRSRLCSLTSELEAQLQRMSFTEGAELGGGEEERRGSIPRRPIGHDLLEGDFSVQSLSSMINEDCFYDARRAGP